MLSWAAPTALILITIYLIVFVDQEYIIVFLFAFPFLSIPLMTVYLGWMWSICKGLKHKLPTDNSPQLSILAVALTIPFLFVTLLSAGLLLRFVGLYPAISSESVMVFLFVSFYLLSVAGLTYGVLTTAKVIKSIRIGKEANLSNYLGEVLLIWVFPIGIWVLQPRVNEITEPKKE